MGVTKYPDELRERAIRLVQETRSEDPNDRSVISRVARQLGVHADSLRAWVRQADTDVGRRPGTTTAESQRIRELEREVKELRRTNEILKAASAFFAQEADPHRRK